MNDELQATASILQISDESRKSGWYQLFPAGRIDTADDRGPFFLPDAASVINNSGRVHVELFIDRDHETDLKPPGTAVKAAGWIKELQERDGEIWARIEWTPAAAAEIEAGEYRYLSPVYFFNKVTKAITKVIRASLTNNPNFDMKAIASSNPQPLNPKQETTMNEHLLALAAAIGMKDPKDEKAIADAVKERLSAEDTGLASVNKALGLDEDASEEVACAAIKTLADKADPAKVVPIKALQDVQKQLGDITKERQEEKAAAAVEAAMKEGKVTPAMKDWALSLASAQPDQFKAFVDSAPVVVAPGSVEQTQAAQADRQPTAEDKAVAAQLGREPVAS